MTTLSRKAVKPLRTLKHRGEVHTVAFSPDGKLLATASAHTEWFERPAAARGAAPPVRQPGADTNSHVITAGPGRLVRRLTFWDTATWTEKPVLGHKAAGVEWMQFLSGSAALATVTRSDVGIRVLELWDLDGARRLRSFMHPDTSRLVFSPDGKMVAVVDLDGKTVTLQDVRTGQAVHHLKAIGKRPELPPGREDFGDTVAAVAFSPDGRLLVMSGGEGPVTVWNTATGRKTLSISPGLIPRSLLRYRFWCAAIRPRRVSLRL